MAVRSQLRAAQVKVVTGRQDSTQRSGFFAVLAALAVVLAWYVWVNVSANPNWLSSRPQSSYELLTEAFVSGQTHLKLAPDPRLKTLANPWAGAQGIPRAHDATYFNERYYLYFGAAPVVLLFAPWKILTGGYLPDGAGTGWFCVGGFLLTVSFYRRCQERFFPQLSAAWTFLFVLLLGLGSFVQFELRSTDFYQVPIACAWLCSMVMANALFVAAQAREWRVQAVALAAASLAGGLAVGARPNHFFALSSVALVGSWLGWCQLKQRTSNRRAAGWLWLATLGPAAGVGAMIAGYNYTRFGSASEFGLSYQFAAVDMRGMKLFGWSRIGQAAEGYLLAGREYTRYFPFIRQATENIGLLTWAPFAVIAFAWPAMSWSRRWHRRDWILGVGAPLLAATANFCSLMFYYYVFDRYVLDFLPAFMLIATVMVSIALTGTATGRRWFVAMVLLLAAYTGTHSFVHGLPLVSASRGMEVLARILNRIPAEYERWAGVGFGAVEAEVEFVAGIAGAREVLLATARGKDVLTVRYLDESRAQLQFSTAEADGPASETFDLEPGRHYRLRADLGSLYPPSEHAAYAGWRTSEILRLQRRVNVKLDGRELLDFSSSFYAAEPDRFQLGKNSASPSMADFRGKLALISRGGVPRHSAPATLSGPVRLRLQFPPFRAQVGQPLVATGHAGAGDLFYVFYAGPGRIRFGHDSWKAGNVETENFFYDPEVLHTVELEMGSLDAGASEVDLQAGRRRLRVRMDGREVYDAPRPFNPARAEEVFYGHNGIGASTSEPNFTGPRLHHEVLGAWPAAPLDGARNITVKLPTDRVGQSEPLLVTGKTGAAEIIYLRYPDDAHIQIGYDKWGVGGPISPPIPVASGRPMEIEISLGSLYGPEVFDGTGSEAVILQRLRATVQIRIDGHVVLRETGASYPSVKNEIQIGLNSVSASSCGEKFTGEIIRVETIGAVELR